MSSSLRSVMYMLAVDNLILVFSSIKTNNSIVQTFSLLVQNSFFFRGHLDLTLTTFNNPIPGSRCRESVFLVQI